MNKVYACIDSQADATAVVDGAIWLARRLDVPLGLVLVLQRATASRPVADISGVAGLGSQEAPLEEFVTRDESQSRQEEELGQRLLAAACEQAAAAGLVRHDGRLRHGDLAAVALDLEGDARLFVLGQSAADRTASGRHWEHPMERLVRAIHRPVLVVPGKTFLPPERVVIAFDGRSTAQRAVERVAASALLYDLPMVVAMAATIVHAARERLEKCCEWLRTAGFDVIGEMHQGVPQDVLPQVLSSHVAGLMVIAPTAIPVSGKSSWAAPRPPCCARARCRCWSCIEAKYVGPGWQPGVDEGTAHACAVGADTAHRSAGEGTLTVSEAGTGCAARRGVVQAQPQGSCVRCKEFRYRNSGVLLG
jgi:nucleotide-binding universal stress UspA family protein